MDILAEMYEAGAVIIDRHFIYKSGRHGPGYINMDPLFPDMLLISHIGENLAQPFEWGFDTVASPAVGGIVLATATACTGPFSQNVAAVWADKHGDEFRFERAGFTKHLKNKRVLVVEDLLTTGGSVMKVCREAEKHGATIVGVSVICNRGGVTAKQLGVPRLASMAEVNFPTYASEECPLCTSEVPIVEDIGHGDAYKSAHPEYAGGYVRLLA